MTRPRSRKASLSALYSGNGAERAAEAEVSALRFPLTIGGYHSQQPFVMDGRNQERSHAYPDEAYTREEGDFLLPLQNYGTQLHGYPVSAYEGPMAYIAQCNGLLLPSRYSEPISDR